MWSGHLTTPKSGESGLLELIREVYDLYQVEVINQGKIYQRYADDFLYSHEFHDAVDAWSKNEHQKNYRIVDKLLTNRRDLVESFFRSSNLNDSDLRELLHQFDTTLPTSKTNNSVGRLHDEAAIQFCSCLDMDDLNVLARCCNDAKIFHEVIVVEDLLSLLDGNLKDPLHSCNNRLVAFFFDQLAIYNLIIRNWQYVLAQKKSIVSSTGKGTMTQKSLSSALYSISNLEMSAKEKIIDAAVRQIGQKYQRIRNSGKQI